MMKKIFLFSCLAFLLLEGCKKDPIVLGPIDLGYLALGDFIEMMPIDTAKTYSFAVYKNEQGEEKRLQMEWFELEREKSAGTTSFTHEQVNIQYYDADDASYQLSIVAGGGLNSIDNTLYKILVVSITSNLMLTPMMPIYEDRFDLIPGLRFFYSSLQLGVYSFENVYAVKLSDGVPNTSFQELYYSTQLGIVAFEGWNDTLWVLDRYER